MVDKPSRDQFAELSRPLSPTKTLLLTPDSSKSDPVAAKRHELRQAFHQTCELYDCLFDLIRNDESYYERHEPLRHPLIFYFAHPAVFYINKLTTGHYISHRIDSTLEAMMAVGVDEMSWDDLNSAHYEWPSVDAVRNYRASLREFIDEFIQTMPLSLPITSDQPAWIILMGIEHERIHLETSSVIMRMMPLNELRTDNDLHPEEKKLWSMCDQTSIPPKNDWLPVAETTVMLGKPSSDHTYGWDNEYGSDKVQLPAFRSAKQLVSNQEFLEFMNDGGYRDETLWTEEGQGWLHYTRATHPRFWSERSGKFVQRNLLNEIPLPLDWPVEVNCLEAQAYCAWLARKTGENVQLPTEAHWYALRATLPPEIHDDQPHWKTAPGNINLENGASSTPVNHFPQGAFCDVIGNVWQWTRTPIMPFKGFEVHPLYDDFSVPTFDGRHNLIKGGSWISTGNEALISSRYAFRRHFFQHAGFRTIVEEPGSEAVTEGSRLYETDQLVTQYIEFHYGEPALGIPNFPQACVAESITHCDDSSRHRCLDIGCSVGRSALEFAQYFDHVDAIDFSARFIQAGVRLQNGNDVLYEIPTEGELTTAQSVSLADLGLMTTAKRVNFMQGDACNLKEIFTDYDLVFAGNLIDRLYEPLMFLESIQHRIRPGGLLILTSPYTWLEEYTPKSKWLGGIREAGEPVSTFDGLMNALSSRFEFKHRKDIPFTIRETSRKHQHSVAEMTVWKKKA